MNTNAYADAVPIMPHPKKWNQADGASSTYSMTRVAMPKPTTERPMATA